MPEVTQSLRVFLASPGDVEAERLAVRGVVEELNGPLRRRGWEIMLFGWEDRGPTGGRAQADINEDVRSCDVFLGVVWERWGTPTGDHSSGFAEEWSIARERHSKTAQPDLWLYFKQIPESAPDSEEFRAVRALREEVADGELAFYKTFEDEPEFTGLVRTRLLEEVLKRSGLTRTDLGGPALDWSAAYHREPVSFLPDGESRMALAGELQESRPEEAAALLVGLADDAASRGFESSAESLRVRACRLWIGAGKSEAAVDLLRSLLRDRIWELRLDAAEQLIRQLREELPPELATELRGWSACVGGLDDPGASAEALARALAEDHPFPLDSETIAHWRAMRWRCLLDVDDPRSVLGDRAELEPSRGRVHLELAFLRAEAQRVLDPGAADAAWKELRLLAVKQATEHPDRAAWISTRAALDAVACEDMATAEAAYTDAATRWTKVAGGSSNSALAFFSAQAASRFKRDWTFTAWNWRPVAAAQIGRARGHAARAEEFQRQGVALHSRRKHEEAVESLQAAQRCYLQAGFIHGIMETRSQLAAVYEDTGDLNRAALIFCMTGEGDRAKKLGTRSEDPAGLAAGLATSWPAWTAEARFELLGRIGSHAEPAVAVPLALEAIAAAQQDSDKAFDNTATNAAEALSVLAVALEDTAVLQMAVDCLQDLAARKHYSLARSGRSGLRMLDDIDRIDAASVLIAYFASDDRPDEPDPRWVSEHLEEPALRDLVRRATYSGNRHALLALVEGTEAGEDPELATRCARITEGVLKLDLGMTDDGKGVHGLMALDVQAAIAVASEDEELIGKFGEMLVLYASETRWPMVNRVSAVRGLGAIAKHASPVEWLGDLEPLARPRSDLDSEVASHLRDMGSRPGDLEGIALCVCAMIATEPPAWLEEAVADARFDERTALREASWFAASRVPAWFDQSAVHYALRDEEVPVRVAALNAWRMQGPPLPKAEALRLAEDPSFAVRLRLIDLLAESHEPVAAARLWGDSDAYVRGIARKRLSLESGRAAHR